MSEVLCVTNRQLCREDFLTRLERIAAAKPAGIILREKDLPFCGIYLPWCRQMGYDGTLSVEADSGRFSEDAGRSLEIMRRLTGAV